MVGQTQIFWTLKNQTLLFLNIFVLIKIDAKLLISHPYTGWKTAKILKDSQNGETVVAGKATEQKKSLRVFY